MNWVQVLKKAYVEKDEFSFAIRTVGPPTWIWRFSLIKRGGLHQTSVPRVSHFRSQTCPSQHLAHSATFVNKNKIGIYVTANLRWMNHSLIASRCALNAIAIFVCKIKINELFKRDKLTASQCQLFFNKKRCRIVNIFDDIIIGPIISSIFVIRFVAIILIVWYNIFVQKLILCVR